MLHIQRVRNCLSLILLLSMAFMIADAKKMSTSTLLTTKLEDKTVLTTNTETSTATAMKLQMLMSELSSMHAEYSNVDDVGESGSHVEATLNLIEKKSQILDKMIEKSHAHLELFEETKKNELKEGLALIQLSLSLQKSHSTDKTSSAEKEKMQIETGKIQLKEQLENLEKVKTTNYIEMKNLFKIQIKDRSQVGTTADTTIVIDPVTQQKLAEHKREQEKLAKTSRGIELANTCASAFMATAPPTFCFKKGGDAGFIPTLCSCGYFRFLALCYQNCPAGYTFVLGICWSNCPSDRTDIGLFCYKSLFDWTTKSSNIPSSATNFSDTAICPINSYKSGALCYRDCARIGLQNCGIGSCSADSSGCVMQIVNIALTTILSVAQFVAFCATLGSAAPALEKINDAKKTMQVTFDAMKNGIKSAFNSMKRIATDPSFRNEFMKEFLKSAKETAIEQGICISVTEVCTSVGNFLMNKYKDGTAPDSFNPQILDFTGVSNAVASCGSGVDMNDRNNKIACAQSVVSVVAILDPTGLTSIAAVFMQPICSI